MTPPDSGNFGDEQLNRDQTLNDAFSTSDK